MKKRIAYILVAILVLAAAAGVGFGIMRKNAQTDVKEPAVSMEEEIDSEAAMKKAVEYLKTIYKDVEKETPRDFERIGVIPIGKLKFQVTWSVNVGEEYVKIVVNENGIVTIDVNEECGEEITYILTATITDADGNTQTLTWEHVIPKKITGSYQEIVDMAYALKPGESMENEATLQGTVTTINTPWDSGYKNITVTIVVEGREDKPIQCYRLKSGAADASQIEKGDLITVTGILKNYNGTIEFDAGCILDANEKGAGKIAKVEGSMQEIVDKAYALKAGETLKGEATLTGSVTAINTAWNSDYKNITVTIVVEGREGKPIQCYRLKSGAADASKIEKGDLITVTGVLKNYNGTIEFDAGCILDANKKGAGTIVTVEGSMQEIVDKAYALEQGASLPAEATLTGSVTAVNTAWDENYKNITVTITVEGREDKPIMCYRMKSGAANAKDVEKGDLITVTGILKNYNGTIEFDAGCVLDANKKGAGTINTVDGSMQEIVDAAYELEVGKTLDGEATLTGIVTVVNTPWDAGWKNVTVTIAVEGREDKPIMCYRLKSGAADAENVAVGDTITVTGIIKNYNGTIEFDAGCTLDELVKSTKKYTLEEAKAWLQSEYAEAAEVTNSDYTRIARFELGASQFKVTWSVDVSEDKVKVTYMPDGTYKIDVTPSTTEDFDYVLTATIVDMDDESKSITVTWEHTVEQAEAEVEVETNEKPANKYKWSLYQANLQKTLYFAGGMNGYYLATTEDADAAVDMYIEKVTGGVLFYYMNGETKTYIDIQKSGRYNNVKLVTEPGVVFTYNNDLNTYVADVEGTLCYIGTYNSNSTFGASSTEYISGENASNVGVTQFVAQFSATPIAYKYALEQAQLGKKLYFAGGMNGYYLATTEDANAAVDMYIEEVTNGVLFYYMDGETKTYIDIQKSGRYNNVKLVTEPGVVFVYNSDLNTYVADVEGTLCYIGTYNENTTLGASATSYISGDNASNVGVTQFIAYFEDIVETETETESNEKIANKYKWSLYQAKLQKTLYFAGGMNGYYLATTEDANAAVDMYIEEVTNGVLFYYMEGETKTYIDIQKSGRYNNVKLVTEPGVVFTYDSDLNTYVANVEGTTCYIGTYNENTTFGASATSYISGDNASNVGVTQFVAQFEATPIAYKYAVEQIKLGKKLYFAGGMNGYYLATTEDANAAVDMYIEEVTNGVLFYYMEGETKTYIDIQKSGRYNNVKLVTEPGVVFVYNSDLNTYVADVDGTLCYIGTYNENTTLGASATSYISGDNASNVGVTQFVAYFE